MSKAHDSGPVSPVTHESTISIDSPSGMWDQLYITNLEASLSSILCQETTLRGIPIDSCWPQQNHGVQRLNGWKNQTLREEHGLRHFAILITEHCYSFFQPWGSKVTPFFHDQKAAFLEQLWQRLVMACPYKSLCGPVGASRIQITISPLQAERTLILPPF